MLGYMEFRAGGFVGLLLVQEYVGLTSFFWNRIMALGRYLVFEYLDS